MPAVRDWDKRVLAVLAQESRLLVGYDRAYVIDTTNPDRWLAVSEFLGSRLGTLYVIVTEQMRTMDR